MNIAIKVRYAGLPATWMQLMGKMIIDEGEVADSLR